MNPLQPFTKLTLNFTVHESIWLPSWGLYHMPSKDEQNVIEEFALQMQQVRILLGLPVIVHCWLRPRVADTRHPLNERRTAQYFHGADYNRAAGSKSKRSAHVYGNACDFHVDGMTVPEATQAILPHLERLGLRMEKHDGAWIHLDSKPVINERWFTP